MSRTILLALALLLSTATAAPPPFPVEGAPADARIVLATFFGEMLPGLREIEDDFERETGVALTVQAVPYDANAMWLRTQFLGREPPEAMLLESGLLEQYSRAGLLVDFTERIENPNPQVPGDGPWKEAFRVPLLAQAADVNGRLWFLPYTQYGVGFFYNADMLAAHELNPPETWRGLISNFQTLVDAGDTAMLVAIKPNDAQSFWAASLILECLARPLVPEVNIDHAPGWKFDAQDPLNCIDERVSLEERIIAFERGLTDPSRSPAYEETLRLMLDFSKTWRSDFLSLDGQEVYEAFGRGGVAHTMNGTWYFGTLLSDQRLMAEVSPDNVFDYGTFPFPEITDASTDLPLAGGINQNAGTRAVLFVPRQEVEPWREEAGLRLVEFLTRPDIARVVFKNSDSWDICALSSVPPKAEAEPLLPETRYAFLPIANFAGEDSQALGEFWPLWQLVLGGSITPAEFLERLSDQHREAYERLAAVNSDTLDHDMIKRELGRAFP